MPARLEYLFWNTADSQKDTLRAGGYIARRLLQGGDHEGLAWGADNLRPADWRHAAATRGVTARARALARNLADAAETLNCQFVGDKVQFLHAVNQRDLDDPSLVQGIAVSSFADVFAMKVKVIGDRGELRDYFDLKKIEQLTGRGVEEGIGLYMARYGISPDDASISHIVQGLGYLGDVDEDDMLPERKAEIAAYWRRRQPEVLRSLSRYGAAQLTPTTNSAVKLNG